MSKKMSGNFLGNGWGFPISVNESGNISKIQFEKSVKTSIRLILGTAPGERVMRPDFGCRINELVFAPNNSNTRNLIAHYIEEALVKWEPRIVLDKVYVSSNEFDDAKIDITINFTIRSINSAFNMVYPFYLERGESDTKSQFG